MEKVLLKMAKQLAAFDEASMMALWDKYAEAVKQFEPTKRWEETALVFCLIQAARLKNQLFNEHWASQQAPPETATLPAPQRPAPDAPARLRPAAAPNKRGKLLSFKPKDGEEA
ncbi:MAG: hypothetical protein HQK81_05435 [Desulfovibrionaceae bacterium]|nr:hypothetical protein [Desulfovibrionaceae bacterium]MBF0513490.1 hypothetical protein [Desulfovibrionaceae bacterium]